MEGLARTLTLLMDRTVVDETGLKGYYDFDVNWSGPGPRDGLAPDTQFGGPELVGLLISNIQNRAVRPVERWIVDHVEPPTDN